MQQAATPSLSFPASGAAAPAQHAPRVLPTRGPPAAGPQGEAAPDIGYAVRGTPAVGPRISVFLLDDHEVVRRGVRTLLEAEPGITVIGEAGTAASALARIPALRPDVAVLDVRLPDGDGVTVCRELRSRMPALACLMLTAHDDGEALFDAVMAGAAGYVLKQIRGAHLAEAVRAVAAGESILDPDAAGKMMARARAQAHPDPLAGLTGKEREVLDLIGEGLTNRQIAERIYLSEKTVKNYTSALYAKLGMHRRTQVVAYAVRIPAGRATPAAAVASAERDQDQDVLHPVATVTRVCALPGNPRAPR